MKKFLSVILVITIIFSSMANFSLLPWSELMVKSSAVADAPISVVSSDVSGALNLDFKLNTGVNKFAGAIIHFMYDTELVECTSFETCKSGDGYDFVPGIYVNDVLFTNDGYGVGFTNISGVNNSTEIKDFFNIKFRLFSPEVKSAKISVYIREATTNDGVDNDIEQGDNYLLGEFLVNNPVYSVLTFTLNGDGSSYSVTDCDTTYSGSVAIPSTYEGLPVTAIGTDAFRDCTQLTGVKIPDSVTSMGGSAFRNCTNLKEIILPQNISTISGASFNGCTKLQRVVIPSKVVSVGGYAFGGCSALKYVFFNGDETLWNNIIFGSNNTPLTDAYIHYNSTGEHLYSGEWTIDIEPTCTKMGSKSHHCVYCDAKNGSVYISATGHTLGDFEVVKSPDCENKGILGKTCSVCGETVVVDEPDYILLDSSLYPESDHNYSNNLYLTAPFSCEGAKSLKITFSDSTYTESGYDYIHLYGSDGGLIGTYDGGELAGQTFEIDGDNFSVVLISDGTNTNYGFSFAEISYKPDYPDIDALGHSYGDWLINKQATCAEKGERQKECSVCGDIVKEDIEATGHSYGEPGVIEEPTCTESGVYGKVCAVCGDVQETEPEEPEYILVDSSFYPESNHNYSNDLSKTYEFSQSGATSIKITFSDSTETESGYDYIYLYDSQGDIIGQYDGTELAGRTFEIEGDSFSVKLTSDESSTYYGFSFSEIYYKTNLSMEPLGHSYGDWTVETDYTCTQDGVMVQVCERCGDAIRKSGEEGFTDLLIDSSLYPEGEYSSDEWGEESQYDYYFEYEGEKEAKTLTITFSDDAYVNWDACIRVYDGSDNIVYSASSDDFDELYKFGGESVTVPGNSFHIVVWQGMEGYVENFGFESIIAQVDLTAAHRFGDFETIIAPTFLEDGLEKSTCSGCGLTKERVAPALYKNQLTFRLNGDETGYIITDCNGASGDITLPSEYKGLPVVGIGYEAFSGCSGIASLNIPESITRIEGYAFEFCYSLISLELPESITYISSDALEQSFIGVLTVNNDYCMKRLNFGYGHNYFTNLYPLITLKLGKNVSYFNASSFYGLKGSDNFLFEGVTVDSENQHFCSEDGVLYDKNKTKVILCSDEKTECVIPDTVKTIGAYAFYGCNKLTSVEISDNLKFIEKYSFGNCSELTNLNIPGSVRSIGDQAFGACRKLSEITLNEGISSLGSGIFYGCKALEHIVLPGTITSVVIPESSDRVGTFYACYAKTITVNNSYCAYAIDCDDFLVVDEFNEGTPTFEKMILGPNVYEIKHESTEDYYYDRDYFIDAKNVEVDPLNKVFCVVDGVLMTKDKKEIVYFPWGVVSENYVIPDYVTTIGESAFCERLSRTGLEALTINNGDISFENNAFNSRYDSYYITTLYLPDVASWCRAEFSNVKSNPMYISQKVCFEGAMIKDLVIPGEVKNINAYAFNHCTGIESITIENGVESIGGSAFGNIYELKTITLPESLNNLSDDAFSGCCATEVIVNNAYAFDNMASGFMYPSEVNVVIGKYVDEITCENSRIYNVKVESGNNNFCTDDGVLFNKDKTKLIYYPLSCSDYYEIPDTVTTIGEFSFTSKLTSSGFSTLKIPDSVNKIENGAFEYWYDSPYGKTLEIEDVKSWCMIDFEDYSSNPIPAFEKVYFNNRTLNNLVIPGEVKSLNDFAFCGCKDIKTVVIEEGVESIGSSVFADCENIESFILPETINSIAEDAFESCSIKEITVNNNYSANSVNFMDLGHNNIVVIGAKVDQLDFSGFNARNVLVDEENIVYTEEDGVLFNKDKTKLVYYPVNAGETNDYEIPSTTKIIGSNAFSSKLSYNYLDSLKIGNNVTKFEADAFDVFDGYGNHIDNLYLPDVSSWCQITFINECSNPISVSNKVLFNDSVVENIVITSETEKIGKFAFYDADFITSLVVEDGAKSIGEYAFRNCDKLESVDIAGSVKIIDRGAFMYCRKLGDVKLRPGVEKLGHYSFYEAPYEVDKAVLSEITIPATTTYISRYAFSNLETVIGAEDTYAQQFAENLVYDFIPCVHEIENALCVHCGINYSLAGLLTPVSSDTRIDEANGIIYTTLQAPYDINELVVCEDGAEIVVQTKNNTLSLATDTKISVFKNNKAVAVYTLVICGDLNGDGVCDVLDVSQTALLANEFEEETVVEAYAANGNDYAEVNVLSYQNVVNVALS